MNSSIEPRGFRPGDVLSWVPENRWCREGLAIVSREGGAFDTYWASGGNAHRLSAAELASAGVVFNIDDFRELDLHEHYTFNRYVLSDRAVVTSQHGLQRRLFIRNGAIEDRATIIENARAKVREAEEDRDAAERRVTYAREALARVEAGQEF